MVGRAFTLAHTGFSRFLRDRLVRKQTNPDFSTALDETRHCHATSFDLTVGDPTRLEHFQSVITERQHAPAPGFPGHASALLLAVLNFFRHQHKIGLWSLAIGCWPNPLLTRSPDDPIIGSPDLQNAPTAWDSRFFVGRISPR